MPGTPLRKPISVSPTTLFEEKPHKKLIRRTLSYRQPRRPKSDVVGSDCAIDTNLNIIKPLSNSARNLHTTEDIVPKIEKNDLIAIKRPKAVAKPQRPMSLDLDAVARVLNANWTDDFKVALFHPSGEDFSVVPEDGEIEKNDKMNGAVGFKKSLKKKDIRKKLTLQNAFSPTSMENLKSPSLGGYIKESWDTLFTKMTERHSTDMREFNCKFDLEQWCLRVHNNVNVGDQVYIVCFFNVYLLCRLRRQEVP